MLLFTDQNRRRASRLESARSSRTCSESSSREKRRDAINLPLDQIVFILPRTVEGKVSSLANDKDVFEKYPMMIYLLEIHSQGYLV